MNIDRSKQLFEEAQRYIPGGVNSPVRAFKSVGMHPVFIARGQGSRVWDADGNEYLDYLASWGPLILGHAHPAVVEALNVTAKNGTSFGAPTALEVEMAQAVVEAVPSVEEVRMVSSGTEATMSALRVARGFTGREKIVKCVGCYHGHSDSLLVQAGSGVTTLGLPDSPGVTKGAAADTLNAPFNDLGAFESLFSEQGGEIAAVIVEPVAGNMGVVPPQHGFLEGLRRLTSEHGAVLIFDEVITGFRVSYGGAQQRFGVMPDLTCLGKTIGGGLPVGAFGGRRDIMEQVAPSGTVYQAGTLSGNPLAMVAGIVTLRQMREPGIYDAIEAKAQRLAEGVRAAASAAGVAVQVNQVGSMLTTFFTDQPVTDFDGAKACDTEKYACYFGAMLEGGVYVAPSQFEAGFVSTAHSDADIDRTLEIGAAAFKAVAGMGPRP